MKKQLTEKPPQCNLRRMYSFPQNRVFLGFLVRFRLKNYWVVAQSKLCAVVVQKLEAGSGKNNVGNTRCCLSQGFESSSLSDELSESAFPFDSLGFWASLAASEAARDASPLFMLDTSQIGEIQRIKIIITRTSLKNVGEIQVDVRHRAGYKAVIL
jgi:hypothetical protein